VKKLRVLSSEEEEKKSRAICELAEAIARIEGAGYAISFEGDVLELGAVNHLFYEGLAERIDSGVLEEGCKFVLGEVLVKNWGCSWMMMERDGTDELCIVCPELDEPIEIGTIDETYRPVDTEGEEVDLGDCITNAYEVITREIRRRRYGIWIPDE
jgi:hypothetical protein